MRTLIILGLFILFLISVQFASAQTVDEVIDKYIAARGGKEKLNAIKSIYMEGSREMMGNEITVKITKEQGKLSRTEFETGNRNSFVLITGKGGWNYFPMKMEAPKEMDSLVLAASELEMDIAGPLIDYVAKGHKAELEGKENVEGIACYKIKLTTKAGKQITYWIQASNYLLLQSTAMGGMMMGRRRDYNPEGGAPTPDNKPSVGKALIIYSDYKEAGGVLFPYSLQTKTEGGDGQTGSGTTFGKIEINKPVDEKLFKPE